MDATTTTRTPIYVSYSTFVTFLDWLRDMKVIPHQLDRTLWGPKFSGSTGVQLMGGLRFLGLLEDERPQPLLEQIALASNEDRKPLLADLIRSVYGAEFVAGLSKATPRMLQERLEALGSSDATVRKAQSWFVNAAKAADIPMPGHIAKTARNKPPRRATGRAGRADPAGQPRGTADTPPAPTPRSEPPAGLDASLHPTLVPLLRDLAIKGPTWDAEDHDGWRRAWDTMLDYAYPVQADEEDDEEE